MNENRKLVIEEGRGREADLGNKQDKWQECKRRMIWARIRMVRRKI